MRPLELEFLPGRRDAFLGWALLVAGLLLLLMVGMADLMLHSQTVQVRQSLPAVVQPSQHNAAVLSAPQRQEQAAALAEVQRLSVQLSRPWEQLFSTLEELPREDVALLSLNCNASSGQLRLTAEARSLEAMLLLHRQLEESRGLSDVSLLSHEVVNRQGQRPVLFNLQADWEVSHEAL